MKELLLHYLKDLLERYSYDGCNDLSELEEKYVQEHKLTDRDGDRIIDNSLLLGWLINQIKDNKCSL